MRIFDRAYEQIHKGYNIRQSGSFNCIPFPDELSRLRNHIPGLQRKNYVIVTANSGVGKSKFTKFAYVICPHEFVLTKPEAGIKLTTLYFCLEESRENFIQSLICYRLRLIYGIRMDIKVLKSIHYERYIDAETLEKVNEMRDYFYQLEDNLIIIDDVRNPTGIYKTVQKKIEENGHWVMKNIQVPTGDGMRDIEVKDHFVHDDEQHYFQAVTDHVSLLSTEKGAESKHEAMSLWSSQYAISLRDKYYASVTDVQQQAAATEKQQWTNKGQSIEDKLEPSLDGLGDNKLTGRNADEIIGLFAPRRYQISSHRGYNIELLKDNYRSAIILKSRDGSPDLRTGLFFDGATNFFKELPKVQQMQDSDYEEYLRLVDRGIPGNTPGNISVNFG
jgi:hypothetical protein